MKTSIQWLTASYWVGAIVDILAAIQMLFPGIFALTNRLTHFNPPIEYRYAMGMGASLMLGWTLLLIWASRKPLERKAILLITIFPVVFGLMINEIGAVVAAFIPLESMLPVWLLQIALVALFAYSYWRTRASQ